MSILKVVSLMYPSLNNSSNVPLSHLTVPKTTNHYQPHSPWSSLLSFLLYSIKPVRLLRSLLVGCLEGQEGEKEKPYISVEVARQKELDLRQPVREQEQEKKGEEHPEHISD
jgi:hypothetical protein